MDQSRLIDLSDLPDIINLPKLSDYSELQNIRYEYDDDIFILNYTIEQLKKENNLMRHVLQKSNEWCRYWKYKYDCLNKYNLKK